MNPAGARIIILISHPDQSSQVGSSNVKHVDLALLDEKQHAIPVHNHLANFLGELVILRRKRKASGYEAELS